MSTNDGNNRNTMRYVGLASQWMAMLGVSVWLGWKIDKAIGWKFPLLTLLLPLTALSVSLWRLIKEFNQPKK